MTTLDIIFFPWLGTVLLPWAQWKTRLGLKSMKNNCENTPWNDLRLGFVNQNNKTSRYPAKECIWYRIWSCDNRARKNRLSLRSEIIISFHLNRWNSDGVGGDVLYQVQVRLCSGMSGWPSTASDSPWCWNVGMTEVIFSMISRSCFDARPCFWARPIRSGEMPNVLEIMSIM